MISHPVPGTDTRAVSVFVAAHHRGVRGALWRLLEDEPGLEPLAATASLADLIRLLARLAPDVVVVDEPVLGDAGLRRLPILRALAPPTRFLVVGMHDHPGHAAKVREAGAEDYLRLDEAADRLGGAVAAAGAAAGIATGAGPQELRMAQEAGGGSVVP